MIAEEQRGHLTQFIHVPEAAVIRIVKEFYTMLKATEKIRSDCSVRFRGTWVSIDPDWINASYDGNRQLQALIRQNLDPLEITNVICDGDVEWTITTNGVHHKAFSTLLFIC